MTRAFHPRPPAPKGAQDPNPNPLCIYAQPQAAPTPACYRQLPRKADSSGLAVVAVRKGMRPINAQATMPTAPAGPYTGLSHSNLGPGRPRPAEMDSGSGSAGEVGTASDAQIGAGPHSEPEGDCGSNGSVSTATGCSGGNSDDVDSSADVPLYGPAAPGQPEQGAPQPESPPVPQPERQANASTELRQGAGGVGQGTPRCCARSKEGTPHALACARPVGQR